MHQFTQKRMPFAAKKVIKESLVYDQTDYDMFLQQREQFGFDDLNPFKHIGSPVDWFSSAFGSIGDFFSGDFLDFFGDIGSFFEDIFGDFAGCLMNPIGCVFDMICETFDFLFGISCSTAFLIIVIFFVVVWFGPLIFNMIFS
jgi:hypothetical protein